MVDLYILEGLSFSGAELYLEEAGYVLEDRQCQDSEECDVLIVYPYYLYDEKKRIIDKVGYAEYCNIDYNGEMDEFRCKWIKCW